MTKRKNQNEQAGHFTDADGYKVSREAAPPVNPSHAKSPEACTRSGEYPHRGEIALTGRAVKERWPITETMKSALVDRMAGIVSNGEDNESIAAGRVMVTMESQNQKDHQVQQGYAQGGVHINIGQNATEPAEVDFEYLQWRKARLMGIEDPEPSRPLQRLVEARRTEYFEPEPETLPVFLEPAKTNVRIFVSAPVKPNLSPIVADG